VLTNAPVVLIVEDDANDAFFATRAIDKARLHCTARFVEDGESAIAYLAGQGRYADREAFPMPALVLLDLKLPRLSGHEVLRWLRSQPVLRRVPVIVMTSSSHPDDVADALDAGANAYVVKPGGIEDFVGCMRSIGAFWLGCHVRAELRTPSRV
jgi:CheY-like chemotaxis protein